jgi:hypothetical protein
MVVGSKNHDFDFDYIILITKKKVVCVRLDFANLIFALCKMLPSIRTPGLLILVPAELAVLEIYTMLCNISRV